MQQATKCKKAFAAVLAVLVLAGAAAAQEKKLAAKPLERKTLDESIYQSLRGVIDHGADLYNQGDWNGCYRLWEGALMSVKPMLDHRPKLQEAIDSGLSKARQDPVLWQRAWALRPVLDKIRSDINADYPHKRKREASEPPLAADEAKKKTLWDRLGGEPGVTKIVDDFVDLAAPDPKIDFFRRGKYKPTDAEVAKMKREIIQQISQATGGPLKYTGPDMKSVHKGMGITQAQFDAAAADLKQALEKNKVAPEDVKRILDAVGSYRKEIVEPKKGEEEKQEEKKKVKPPANSEVSGVVLFKGQPAAGAKISLVAGDGKAVSDTTAADGSYRIAVNPGEYTVTVSGPAKLGLPAKYAGVNTSGLKLNVIQGKQTHDLNLK
jgi:hemoglobin